MFSLAFEEQLLYIFEVCRLMVKVGATSSADMVPGPREGSGGSVSFRPPCLEHAIPQSCPNLLVLARLGGSSRLSDKAPQDSRNNGAAVLVCGPHLDQVQNDACKTLRYLPCSHVQIFLWIS